MTIEECDTILKIANLKRVSEFKGSTKKIVIECYCGNKFETEPCKIKSGNTKSCGCYKQKIITVGRIKDLTDQKFGKLTVKKYIKTIKRKPIWLCKCDCGNTKEIRGCSLKSGLITTCGCHLKGCGNISKTYWSKIVIRAKKANLSLEVSIQELWNLFEKQKGKCALSGLTLHFAKFYNKEKREQTASLDRIDSKKHYTIDNVQWVHKEINLMKNKLPQERFLNLCSLITNHNFIT